MLALHPGKNRPAGLSYRLESGERRVTFAPKFANPCPTGSEVDLNVLANGTPVYRGYLQAAQPLAPLAIDLPEGTQIVRFKVGQGQKEDFCDELWLEDLRWN